MAGSVVLLHPRPTSATGGDRGGQALGDRIT